MMNPLSKRALCMFLVAVYSALLLALCVATGGCSVNSLMVEPGSRPPGCEQSIIYDHLPVPKVAGAVLLIAVNESARAKPEAVMYLLGAIDAVLELLQDDQVTYVELAMQAAQQISWVNTYFGNRLLIYSELIAAFDLPAPLYPCDRMLIRNHLKKQRDMLTMGADP